MFDILKIHPIFTHFAIAFPIYLLLMDLYYRLTKREWDGLHALFTYISLLAVVGGTVSGIISHEPVEELLEGVLIFEVHEILGKLLAPLAVFIGVLRFLKKKKAFTLALLLLIVLLLIQGSLGGSLVYDHLIKLGSFH